jgi:hypothetical protein
MIINKNVEITISKKNIKYYKNLGYNSVLNSKIVIDISHLPLNSKFKIECKCDICHSIKNISYSLYNKSTTHSSDLYYCNKCSYLKIKKNNLLKYGVENVFQSEIVKDKIKQTNLEKYGFENPNHNIEIRNKIKETNLEKYGHTTPLNKEKRTIMLSNNFHKWGVYEYMETEDFKIKSFKKIKEKYGVVHINKNNEIKEKIKNTIETKTILKYTNILNNDYKINSYTNNVFVIEHNKCGKKFKIFRKLFYDRLKLNNCLCTECYPISELKSIKEKEIFNWLSYFKLPLKIVESDREVLKGKELDIYFPSKDLAIEFNGLYYHSEYFKDKNYHLEKSLMCLEQGIQLLHIWEDEWVYKKEIVKSIILNRLGLIKEKIYARQCEIRVVEDSKLVRQFLDENHIQGYSQSSIKLGLYYKNELVSLMTFGYRHTNAKKEFELIRFCNRINLNVIGAASKLFNYFKQNYEFTDLISYSDFRLFDGKMYETLGFEKKHLSHT